MERKIKDVMSLRPIILSASATLREAAEKMKDRDIGAVLVEDGGKLCGIATDRDIVVRAIAIGRDPSEVKLREVCTEELTTLRPSESVSEAVRKIREAHVRRLPVVENGTPIGIVSLGDLAQAMDPRSALASVSSAPPNH